MSPITLSVVISTYNQPEWLEKVLWGYEVQIYMNFEVVIADDGSGPETFAMLERVIPQLSYPVRHVWHEDRGFRKCEILNKAILACTSDYLLFSDGDCIPRADFTLTHIQNRRPGRFLSNGYYKMSMDLSRRISREDILEGRCFDIRWLKANGLPNTFKNNKFTAKGFKRWLLNTFTPANASWNGHGSSAWLTDILAANGFDERMQYGGEDREFGERLENAGIRGKQMRYSTVCIHLDHGRGYISEEEIAKNRALRNQTRKLKITRTPCGIYKESAAETNAPASSINCP